MKDIVTSPFRENVGCTIDDHEALKKTFTYFITVILCTRSKHVTFRGHPSFAFAQCLLLSRLLAIYLLFSPDNALLAMSFEMRHWH